MMKGVVGYAIDTNKKQSYFSISINLIWSKFIHNLFNGRLTQLQGRLDQ